MRMSVMAAVVAVGLAASLKAQAVLLEWPGNPRQPLEAMACFHLEDYLKRNDLAFGGVMRFDPAWAQANTYTRWALCDFTLSLKVRVPLREGEAYPVARFNVFPGNGALPNRTMVLEIAPAPGGGHRLVFRKDRLPLVEGAGAVLAPFPKALANRWAHVALSVGKLKEADAPESGAPGLLAVNGKVTTGPVWCDLWGGPLRFVGLGGPGVGIAAVSLRLGALSGGMSALRTLASRPVAKTFPERRAQPHPTLANDFGNNPTVYGPEQFHVSAFDLSPSLLTAGQTNREATPNGMGGRHEVRTSYANSAFRRSWPWLEDPLVCGDGFAIVFVAKSLSAPGATLFCQSIGTRHYRRDTVFHDHIALETGLRPEDLRLTFALNGREVGPLAFTLPDASTAYHCYALNYDKGTLGLWVDGVPIGKLETPASEWPHDPSAPFLTDPHRLTLTAFRFGRHVADNNTVTFRPDYVIDDLAFYGRALSPKEIAAAAAAFTLTGKPPKANSGRVEPPAKQP